MPLDPGDLLLALTAGLAAATASPWLVVVWLTYVLILAAWILRQRREPVATLAWLLVLAWAATITRARSACGSPRSKATCSARVSDCRRFTFCSASPRV